MRSLLTKKEGEAHTVFLGSQRIGRVYRTPAPGSRRWQAAQMPPSYAEVGRAGTLKDAVKLLAAAFNAPA